MGWKNFNNNMSQLGILFLQFFQIYVQNSSFVVKRRGDFGKVTQIRSIFAIKKMYKRLKNQKYRKVPYSALPFEMVGRASKHPIVYLQIYSENGKEFKFRLID